jgi:Spy/CpxP family protein refolding chaperone
MKKFLAVIAVVAVLGVGTVASAHMFGGGYGDGPMMGWGPGYGYGSDENRAKFLDETAEARQKIHEKRFEYSEALRTGDEKKAEALAKELDELTDEVYTKAPRRGFGRGYGKGYARGYGRGCW